MCYLDHYELTISHSIFVPKIKVTTNKEETLIMLCRTLESYLVKLAIE